jgi:hypothetical protein
LVAGTDVTATVIDVSRDGLGIITSKPIARGEQVWLIVEDRTIKLEVRHCRKGAHTGAEAAGWHCGLRAVGSWDDLESIFLSKGVARPSTLLDY